MDQIQTIVNQGDVHLIHILFGELQTNDKVHNMFFMTTCRRVRKFLLPWLP